MLELNFYCDTYGICTITYGTLTAFVMECYQRGILNQERTGGLDLTWGNADADLEMMHQMARGEGFGVIAGQGVKKMKELFIAKGWGDPQLIEDIGMEGKGLEYSEYISKESLAQQGGYALTNKGPQHDEAWLIFMDMVNKQIPTFEDKAEALYYFPLFRTWFGLNGFCKLPWNDVDPADNAPTSEPAKVPEHVQNYLDLFTATTGLKIDRDVLIHQCARVYNFQRIFNIRMGKGLRANDIPPYRSVGPVTREEYQSRAERYDKQMLEEIGVDPAGKSVDEKIAITREYRLDRYEQAGATRSTSAAAGPPTACPPWPGSRNWAWTCCRRWWRWSRPTEGDRRATARTFPGPARTRASPRGGTPRRGPPPGRDRPGGPLSLPRRPWRVLRSRRQAPAHGRRHGDAARPSGLPQPGEEPARLRGDPPEDRRGGVPGGPVTASAWTGAWATRPPSGPACPRAPG